MHKYINKTFTVDNCQFIVISFDDIKGEYWCQGTNLDLDCLIVGFFPESFLNKIDF